MKTHVRRSRAVWRGISSFENLSELNTIEDMATHLSAHVQPGTANQKQLKKRIAQNLVKLNAWREFGGAGFADLCEKVFQPPAFADGPRLPATRFEWELLANSRLYVVEGACIFDDSDDAVLRARLQHQVIYFKDVAQVTEMIRTGEIKCGDDNRAYWHVLNEAKSVASERFRDSQFSFEIFRFALLDDEMREPAKLFSELGGATKTQKHDEFVHQLQIFRSSHASSGCNLTRSEYASALADAVCAELCDGGIGEICRRKGESKTIVFQTETPVQRAAGLLYSEREEGKFNNKQIARLKEKAQKKLGATVTKPQLLRLAAAALANARRFPANDVFDWLTNTLGNSLDKAFRDKLGWK